MEIGRLLEYDFWATEQILAQVAALTNEQFLHEFAGPFSSVRQQAAHLVTVPDRYRARIMGEAVPDVAPETFKAPSDVIDHFQTVVAKMREMLACLSGSRLSEVIRHDTRAGLFVLTVEQTLMHVVNHGTFHRGQLAMLLKLHEMEPINTDLILWPRLQG